MGISTHILDTALGRPAFEVPVALSVLTGETWSLIRETATDADGRCKSLFPESRSLQPGTYRIRFETAIYYKRTGLEGLYPYIEIVFIVAAAQQHYHIPSASHRQRLHHLSRHLTDDRAR